MEQSPRWVGPARSEMFIATSGSYSVPATVADGYLLFAPFLKYNAPATRPNNGRIAVKLFGKSKRSKSQNEI